MATDKYNQYREVSREASKLVDILIKNSNIDTALSVFGNPTNPVLHEAFHADENLEVEIAKQLLIKKQEFDDAPDIDDVKESFVEREAQRDSARTNQETHRG